MGRVEGKVAIVTGAASGIGAEDARLLAREGAKVILTDVQDALGQKIASQIPGAVFMHQDVRDESRWIEVVAEAINRFGKLDILVNNAGLVRFGSIEELSYEDCRLQVDVMLNGTFLGCRAAIPWMSKDGNGSIINIASTAGIKGNSVIPAYSGAKGGVIAMTRSIALYCQEKGYRIRVNSISPGATDTPIMAMATKELSSSVAGIKDATAHGMGSPMDIANMVVFLASQEGRRVNGANIVIDDGETIR